jgi:hypothetical protein
MPSRFTIRGRSLVLYPAPSASETTADKGIWLYVSRSVSPLENNTDEPGFDREFHGILAIGGAMDWCISAENFKKKAELEKEQQKIMEQAREFYSNRDDTLPNRIRPKRENYA